MLKNSVKPFELLVEYERLSFKHRVEVQKVELKDQWSGVGFRVGEVNYVLAIDKIVEVLIITETTKIPGVSPWVIGLGNIRGNLIPIVDFKAFLFNKPTKITAHTRMVVINQQVGQVGLVVDEVFGQKHFFKKQIQKKAMSKGDLPIRYSDFSYKSDGSTWNILEDEVLINDPCFQNAAII